MGRIYDLPGYHPIEFNTRDKSRTLNSNCGGGVGIYISDSLDYEVLQFENQFIEGIYESIWVKLNLEHNKTKIVGSVYRPCLLYTSPSPRDRQKSRMPSSA